MLPTFEVMDDYVVVDRWYRRGRGIVVGDIVTFDSVIDPGERVIKRVIGVEGDYVLRDTPGSASDQMLQVSVHGITSIPSSELIVSDTARSLLGCG